MFGVKLFVVYNIVRSYGNAVAKKPWVRGCSKHFPSLVPIGLYVRVQFTECVYTVDTKTP